MADPDRSGAREASEPESLADTEFIAALVHEIRNPLAPIFSAAQLLRSLCSDSRQLFALDIIDRQLVQLTHFVDDLLDAADLGRGMLTLSLQNVDVAEIAQQAVAALKQETDAKRQNLYVTLPPEPVHMRCDPVRLLQILQNLLAHASVYTPAGGEIALTVTEAEGALLIQVTDNGYGIEPEALPRIFNLFSHGNRRLHPASSGLGVRLAIARNLVEMHDGTIAAESAGPGQGTRFTVRLPIQPQQSSLIEPQEQSRSVSGHRILIVEDNRAVASSIAACLWDRGYTVVTAEDGGSGLTLAKSFQPEVIIIDIGLPDMDGFEVARELRAAPATADALLVAASGHGLRKFKQLSDHWVFDHYLLKPTSSEALTALIAHALAKKPPDSCPGDLDQL